MKGSSQSCKHCEVEFRLILKGKRWVIPEHVDGTNKICPGSLK